MQRILCLAATLLLAVSTHAEAAKSTSATCADEAFDFSRFAPKGYATVSGEENARLYVYPQHPSKCASPDTGACRGKAYVVSYDRVALGDRCGNWSYVEFIGIRSTTKGWVDSGRLERIDVPPDDEVPAAADGAAAGEPRSRRYAAKRLGFEFAYPPAWRVYYPSSSQGAADRPPIVLAACREFDTDEMFPTTAVAVAPDGPNSSGLYISAMNLDRSVFKGKTFDEYLALQGGVRNVPEGDAAQIGGEPCGTLNDGSIVAMHGGRLYEMFFGKDVTTETRLRILRSFQFNSR